MVLGVSPVPHNSDDCGSSTRVHFQIISIGRRSAARRQIWCDLGNPQLITHAQAAQVTVGAGRRLGSFSSNNRVGFLVRELGAHVGSSARLCRAVCRSSAKALSIHVDAYN
eukprot:92469-Pyramimonas_sp.AAC.3